MQLLQGERERKLLKKINSVNYVRHGLSPLVVSRNPSGHGSSKGLTEKYISLP